MDVLAIGDVVIDDFIRLKDARANCDINNENCMLCVRFGDKVPFEFNQLVPGVGNSPNAAVACARLGLATGLRVHVGADDRGKVCIDALKANGVDTSLVVVEEGKLTNYHYVLWYESERTILVKHESFSYSMPTLTEKPKWMYLSSLADNTLSYHREIAKYVSENPDVKLAFQPGTFQIKLGAEALRDLYAHTQIFFCNKEEAQKILNIHQEHDIKKLLDGVHALGPKIVVITDGREGSYARDESGAMWHAPMYPDPKPPLERTGAGDASASTTVAYLVKGMSLEESLLRGHINSANVVQEIGAQKGLLTAEQIEDWYSRRPADYRATAI
ncbi:carbohydrate kinase family protein [Candidatus Kaiserbacteria bacterium]|nr:carbohydrate kinase family protein [Candidatus Kaiserbacteria bacterium]